MSLAGRSIGTKRRSEIEVGQLLQAARAQTPALSKLPRGEQRKLVVEYHRRVVKGEAIVS